MSLFLKTVVHSSFFVETVIGSGTLYGHMRCVVAPIVLIGARFVKVRRMVTIHGVVARSGRPVSVDQMQHIAPVSGNTLGMNPFFEMRGYMTSPC